MFMLLLLLHLLPSISTSLTRELCIDSQGNRMCLLWNCPDQQSLETCAEQYVLAVCDSNLATSDPQIQSCCTATDKICVSKLIQTTYQTLQQTADKNVSLQQVFTDVYKQNIWGTPNPHDADGPSHFYSGDGANAAKCSTLIEYTNRQVDGKHVVELGCGDMRVSSRLIFDQIKSYVCIDVAPIAVKEAEKVLLEKCGGRKQKNNEKLKCRAVQGNGAINLPFADVLIVKDVLMHWPTSLFKHFSNNIMIKFQTSILTFNEPTDVADMEERSRRRRHDIIPGEVAALRLNDLGLPQEEVVWKKVLSNVCENPSKSTYLVERSRN